MKTECIEHRTALHCSALDEKTVSVRIKTGKDVTAVFLVAADPFTGGVSPSDPWDGERIPMEIEAELRNHFMWKACAHAEWRRLQYYFEIQQGGERLIRLESGFYTPEEFATYRGLRQYSRFPWINSSDINLPPRWVKETVWCQIMPDRFCARLDASGKRPVTKVWKCEDSMSHSDFYGGDLPGITSRLEYLKDLGFSGIYLTPVFLSGSYHRYNTDDYYTIDPDLGTRQDMKEMVDKAHSLGIRVMLDAVFNHCGTGFFAWRDVLEKGQDSPYKDWFFINSWPVENSGKDTRDGRFYSFAFVSEMPKLNTDNPEVQEYFTRVCASWISEWNIDGIRFDVGNEISHDFIRNLSRRLKKQKPKIFLLGEIWHDSLNWLSGGEYDSVMHYPFLIDLWEFWATPGRVQADLMYGMNNSLTMYRDGLAASLFTFLDTHDTVRAASRCGNNDTLLQQLAFLLTMPGSPCLLYGTEVPLTGEDDLQGRKCMPWEQIDRGDFQPFSGEVKKLIALRNSLPQLKTTECFWNPDTAGSRLVSYARGSGDISAVAVFLNVSDRAEKISCPGDFVSRNGSGRKAGMPEPEILYSRLFAPEENLLAPGSILIIRV